MNPSRRTFLAASSAALAVTAPTARAAADGPFQFRSPPVLTNPTPDGVTVLWATSGPATGWIEYGETERLGSKAGGATDGLMPFDERVFKVRLAGLKPGCRYFYRVHAVRIDFRGPYDIRRVGTDAVASEVYRFTTPPADPAEVRFTVWNDTHEVADTLKALHTAHQKEPGDFLLWNGDQTNDITTEERMVAQFLAPAGQPFAATVPYYYVRGNHDVRGPGARHLPRFTDGPLYYSFRRGPMAALVLDTGEDKPDDHPVYGGLNDFAAFRTLQAEWLAKEIEKPEFQSARFKVLFCHIPLWWKREKNTGDFCGDGRAKWHDLLVKAGVQLVVSGHTHEPAWLPAEKGRPYGQLIGGGPKPTAATYLRGHATRDGLTVTQFKLTGEVQYTVKIG
ncbi:FN3 domain-containing metallophosphoesterase family protein [Limnoglobus roseus]|uniref:3',5'-cyclic adenosine monophosphate phosphodiesterase CpdA n=1 Tax=Limnoglobus roseus TaxID=2598579 RepID=A0A5C1AL86_9BACT|nr:FN3 domain-containing metallophosphoesterase family protein [Limnoglobus roseus]QEL17954.1 3',5'-cyclic adenosine monophosphate phosphodiesterase CpdA [Limnoglobus roseus]